MMRGESAPDEMMWPANIAAVTPRILSAITASFAIVRALRLEPTNGTNARMQIAGILFIGPAKSALDCISVGVVSPAAAWACALAVEGALVWAWVFLIRKVYYGRLRRGNSVILHPF
jgi:hypothetical protein